MAWDDATHDGGTWDEPGTTYYVALLASLPDVYDRDPADPGADFLHAFFYGFGRELDRLRYTLDWLEAQAFIHTTTLRIDRWERQLGIPVASDMALQNRRDIALARRRGRKVSVARYLRDILIDALALGGDPLISVYRMGRAVVYVTPYYTDWEWPGDAAFVLAEQRLSRSGSAGFGHYVAVPNPYTGRTGAELDMMAGAALDTLTGLEIEGDPGWWDTLSLDAWDALSLDALDALHI